MAAGREVKWENLPGPTKTISVVDEDEPGVLAEVVRAGLQGWDPVSLIWRRIKVSSLGEIATTGGGGGGGGAVTVADGADVAEGATTDTAVVTDTSGTVSGKLRGLVKWAFERMPASLGQKTMAASLPVVLASDQAAIPVTGAGGGTQYDEDTASAAADKITMAGVVRKDTMATLVDTDGDRTQLQVDSSGQLRVVTPPGGAGLTDTELRASPVPVSGPLTDAQLRAAVVPVGDGGGSLTVDGVFWPGTQPVSGTVTADTELEASAALADASGNPTTPRVGAASLLWNGTGWDRARGDIANGLDVDVTRVQGSVTTVGPAADGAAVSGNPVRIAGKDGSGNTQDILTDPAGRQLMSLSRPWTNLGSYRAVTAILSVAATADAATAGRWWIINPVGSSIGIAVLRVYAYFAIVTEVDMLTAPRITLERMTFTGTASGATITPSKRVRTAVQGQTIDAANVGTVRTASTGLTPVAGELEHAFIAPTYSLTTSGIGVSQPPMNIYGVSERGEDALILAAGEGMVCRQADAGSTTDGRRFVCIIEWEEFTT
jgi:hypothetical protein